MYSVFCFIFKSGNYIPKIIIIFDFIDQINSLEYTNAYSEEIAMPQQTEQTITEFEQYDPFSETYVTEESTIAAVTSPFEGRPILKFLCDPSMRPVKFTFNFIIILHKLSSRYICRWTLICRQFFYHKFSNIKRLFPDEKRLFFEISLSNAFIRIIILLKG